MKKQVRFINETEASMARQKARSRLDKTRQLEHKAPYTGQSSKWRLYRHAWGEHIRTVTSAGSTENTTSVPKLQAYVDMLSRAEDAFLHRCALCLQQLPDGTACVRRIAFQNLRKCHSNLTTDWPARSRHTGRHCGSCYDDAG